MEDKSGFVKADRGKAQWHLLPFQALDEVVKVYEFGAGKYAEDNWRKGDSYKRMWDAMMRHMVAWRNGENVDDESKCHHLSAVVFGALSLMTWQSESRGKDDRTSEDSWAEKVIEDIFGDIGGIKEEPITEADAVPMPLEPAVKERVCDFCHNNIADDASFDAYTVKGEMISLHPNCTPAYMVTCSVCKSIKSIDLTVRADSFPTGRICAHHETPLPRA